jgi:hypothetical protein
MEPEHTSYQHSPHARVLCTECHIGSGAEWYVKSKLTGLYQVYAVVSGDYHLPIQTPVENLRPAQDTCEACHWPGKFSGSMVKEIMHFSPDQANTPMRYNLLLKVGGGEPEFGQGKGIHWHINQDVVVRYWARDRQRLDIPWVEVSVKGEAPRVFKSPDYTDGAPPEDEIRTMDCIDCHNRPSHIYREPQQELDQALLEGRIDRTLPYIKREGLRLLTEAKYESHEAARAGLAKDLKAFYAANYPDLADSPAVEQAGKALGDAYAWNVFPKMKVTWNTYPNHIGHKQSPGCFRCHDNKHKTADGGKIGKKCSTCHEIVADEETDSKLLQELGLQEEPAAPAEPAAAEATTAAAPAQDGAAAGG